MTLVVIAPRIIITQYDSGTAQYDSGNAKSERVKLVDPFKSVALYTCHISVALYTRHISVTLYTCHISVVLYTCHNMYTHHTFDCTV